MKLDVTSITNDNAAALIETGGQAIRSGDLTIDLSAVKQVDSAAVALLLQWQRGAGRHLSHSPRLPHLAGYSLKISKNPQRHQ